jgi:mono/diheme cytochrome c family protein
MLNPRTLLPLALLSFTALAAGAATLDRNTGDGVYTAAQADAGALLFEEVCMQCHLPNWERTVGFYAKWQGRPLRDLAEYLRLEMPQTDPGTLTPDEYAAVTAYLLRLTGNPAGATPLSNDADALMDIRIDTLRSAR